MNSEIVRLVALVIFAICSSIVCADEAESNKQQHTFVIVHGAGGGGWDWKAVDQKLSADGNVVYRPTLTGLGERVHLANPDINLTTHIDDIVNVILFEDLQDVVLVAHSYGGMVVTGVMNSIPERIKHAIFLDAAVPNDGMAAFDLWRKSASDYNVVDGHVYFPWIDTQAPYPSDVPQSLKTFTEPVSYNNPSAQKLDVTYIALVPPGMSIRERTDNSSWRNAESRNWTMRTFDGDHVVYRSRPAEIAELLEIAIKDRNQP